MRNREDFISLNLPKEIKMATASNEFKLIGPSGTERYNRSTVTLSCGLSPEISAVNMEIRWFKETDCVCVYKNREVTEGRGYRGRVSLFTQELERGNVSLQLKDCTESDGGYYLCQVTDGDRTEEITVEMKFGSSVWPPVIYKDIWVDQRDRKWTENERKKIEESALQIVIKKHSASQRTEKKDKDSCTNQPLPDVEIFIPELVENCDENKNKDEYRFLCPRAGRFMCKLTKLVFEMDGKGEVLYRIVSWDSCFMDGLGQQQPAGPLYSIACHEGSIHHMHLPHCEICTDEVKLSAAHVTGVNVELIQPLKVTSTHAIIDIQGLSLFGLLRALLFREYPITAQVLLFYKKINGKHRMSKLHMHLLPGNVTVEEVKKQHLSITYIETSSNCELTPGKKYRPCCKNTDHDYVIQPKIEKFHCDYGPNYHPTFEMLCNIAVDKVTLGLLDENDQEVWERLVLLTGTGAASPTSDTGADFIDQYRVQLIQRVTAVMEIADCLRSKNMINDENYRKIHAESTSCERMRLLYSSLDAGGRVVKAEAYKVLKEKEPYLVEDLSDD